MSTLVTISQLVSTQHPVSVLNELEQRGLICELAFECWQRSASGLWIGQLGASCPSLKLLNMNFEGTGSTKKCAKREAAANMLLCMMNVERDPSDNDSDTCTDWSYLLPSPTTKHPPSMFTKRQSLAISKAKHHTRTLNILARDLMEEPDETCIMSIDVEKEECGERLLEVGLSALFPGESYISTVHYIVEEHLDVVNGRFVPDRKFEFSHGRSTTLTQQDMVSQLNNALDTLRTVQHGYLTGHTLSNDVNWLRRLGVCFDGIVCCDLAQAFVGETETLNAVGLSRMAGVFGVVVEEGAHNAGNDSHVTLELTIAMATEVVWPANNVERDLFPGRMLV